MSISQSARKIVACWCSMVAIPAVVFGQNSFMASGGQQSIVGALPGDQVHPCVSFTTNGGYIVWQDNAIDAADGLGIGAMRLKNDLSSSHVPFRVNSLLAGDHENAQVAMLNNGGAVFVWQAGPVGLQHIYARFLSPSNTWLTGDVLVNSVTNCFQTAPAVASLLSGNVVVVYASKNQVAPGSLQDVYFQMFAPTGSPIGSETLVNQFTSNNQRSPAVAGLANGNYGIAWVSEQERWTDASNGVPSVDIDARVFDSDGTPSGVNSGNEFLVNVSSNVCAYPALAASPDGGFMATWMEKDLVVVNNGWDIYARRFPANSTLGGNETRINTQLYGDQYLPRIQSAGTNYLVVWTSLGQDGSKEGVFGTFLNDDASTSGSEMQINTTTYGSQMHQTIGSDGVGRFLVAWTSFGSPSSGFDLFGQRYINPATASIGINNSVFNTDPNANSNSVVSPQPSTPVPLSLPPPPLSTNLPVPVTLTLAQVKGVYSGLVYDLNAVNSANSGYVTITTTTTGSFSAKLQLNGKSYSFSGKFSASGSNSTTVGPWTINLLLDLKGGYQITGQLTSANSTLSLQAYMNVYGAANKTPLSGPYTMVVQSDDPAQAMSSIGNGIGTVTVSASGDVQWKMTLPDGTSLSEKTTLSQGGQWPIYAAPYKGGGVVVGWVQFNGASKDGFTGNCVWTKPAGAAAPYTGGLTNSVTIHGSAYQAPPLAFRAFGPSQVVLNGGGLSNPITNSVMWSFNNKISGANKLSFTLTPSSGLFKGSVVDPATGNSVPFQGVLYEKGNVGLGFFPGGNQSGAVSFAPNP